MGRYPNNALNMMYDVGLNLPLFGESVEHFKLPQLNPWAAWSSDLDIYDIIGICYFTLILITKSLF